MRLRRMVFIGCCLLVVGAQSCTETPLPPANGIVSVTALLNTDGTIARCFVGDSLRKPTPWEENAVQALRSAQFTPALVHGKPVRVWMEVPMDVWRDPATGDWQSKMHPVAMSKQNPSSPA